MTPLWTLEGMLAGSSLWFLPFNLAATSHLTIDDSIGWTFQTCRFRRRRTPGWGNRDALARERRDARIRRWDVETTAPLDDNDDQLNSKDDSPDELRIEQTHPSEESHGCPRGKRDIRRRTRVTHPMA